MGDPTTGVVRLVITSDDTPGKFTARLEGTGEVIVQRTGQPLVDGARVLLDLGYEPATPLTMRHAGKPYDSFRPSPIGRWARRSYEESDKKPLRTIRWMPFPAAAGNQKSGSTPSVGSGAHPTEIRFYGGPPDARDLPAALVPNSHCGTARERAHG